MSIHATQVRFCVEWLWKVPFQPATLTSEHRFSLLKSLIGLPVAYRWAESPAVVIRAEISLLP